ncbi:O-antigen ligase [Rhizobium mesoamericanum]|uniref:O-antigen ligase family protein n=1 Tax=Rhizobium mesoamericanum TaxID=1079800 RepID=UPI00277E1A42|nr:O-antigen ligase family protein [Rhizobium mesoamericanum]MDQ0559938.1 O-antigen ligase [Rhizobium mesoamericanum]
MVRFMTTLIACLVPFALWEWLTGAKPLLVAFGTIFPTVDEAPMVPRMGLWRVQGPFSHSILFGVFCGSMLALVSTVARTDRSRFAHILLVCLVGGITVMSMSSAPIAGIAFQIALLSWEKALRVFRYRWTLLGGLALIGYLVIALGSNQTPVQFYISRFTFDQQTGWYRLAIWNYGSASVANHPIFGIGLGDWARPQWMGSDSVDNFWLLTSMRFGLPGLLLMFLSWAYLWTSIGLRKQLNYTLSVYRTGYLICMVTFVFVGSTVHFWGPTYSWFFFAAGCGAWLLDAKAPQNNPDPQAHPMRGRMSTRPTVGRKALGPVPFTNSDCLN